MLHGLLVLALVLIAVGLLWSVAVVVGMAHMLLRPRRMNDVRALLELHRLSPADLGLPFEDVSFPVIGQRNGKKLNIAGWWMGHPDAAGKCALIVHGYSDAKVGGIAWAPLLREMGFSILAIDLRAHGESGGAHCTAGFWERHDLNQVIDQLRAERPEQTRRLLLFGVSLGAAVVAAAATLRDDLWAVVLECPYVSFQKASAYMADRLGMPGPMFQRWAFRLAQWIGECDFSAVRPVDLIGKIPCPLMVIQAADDPFVSAEDQAAIRAAVQSRPAQSGPNVLWQLPGVHHVVALCDDPAEYRRRMQDFLSAALPSTVGLCEK